MKIICVQCPLGCRMEISERDGVLHVEGNACKKGRSYAVTEHAAPRRVVTTILVTPDTVYSVKTNKPILRKYGRQAVAAIKAFEPRGNYQPGDVLIPNLLGLGASVIVTGLTRR